MKYFKKTFGGEYFFVALVLVVGIALSVSAGWLKHPTIIGLTITLMLCIYLISRINEASRITDEVNRTKKEIELILHSSSDAIIGIDSSGNINLCNATALHLLGYSRKDLMGRHHRVINYSESEQAFFDPSASLITKTISEGLPSSSYEENFWKKDSTSVLVEYTVAPLIDEGDIKGAVMVFRDITERRKQLKQLEQLARYDHLTGIANRALFIDLLKKSVARAQRTGTKVALIFIDLNEFKPVNDNFGHRTGDTLLKAFADRVKSSLRLYDTFARMGGDEFIILAENINGAADCEVVVNRLISLIETPFSVGDESFSISAAMGISIFPDDAIDLDSLISHADSAMYVSKKDKSKFCFFKSTE